MNNLKIRHQGNKITNTNLFKKSNFMEKIKFIHFYTQVIKFNAT